VPRTSVSGDAEGKRLAGRVVTQGRALVAGESFEPFVEGVANEYARFLEGRRAGDYAWTLLDLGAHPARLVGFVDDVQLQTSEPPSNPGRFKHQHR
jgi:hypothetical protein